MAGSFDLDLTKLRTALMKSPELAGRGARHALSDIKDDWVREAVDVAPLDTGNLRRQIHGEVEGVGIDSSVVITANATQNNGSRFNYAYYIHEGHMSKDGKSLRTPGTVEKFLDQPAEKRLAEWQRWLEEEVEDELRKAGW